MARRKIRKQEFSEAMRDRPATPNQTAEIKRLGLLVGAPLVPSPPMTCWQASQDITALNSRLCKGIFGRAATARASTELRLWP